MRAFLKRFQFVLFLTLTFIISWSPWYTGEHGFNAWGPSLAGLIVVAVVDGWLGVRGMLRRLFRWRVGIGWWAVALLVPSALTLAAVGAHVLTGGEPPPFTFWKQDWYLAPVLVLIFLSPFGGPGGEEPFGWRGYAQPILQKMWGKWGPLVASVVIGIVWAVWHLPEFFNPTSTQYAVGLGFFIPMLGMWIAASIVMTWVYNGTGGSVLVSGVIFHLTLNVSSATSLADFTLTGMTEGIPPLDVRLLTAQIVLFALVALVIVAVTRGRLGYTADDAARAAPGLAHASR